MELDTRTIRRITGFSAPTLTRYTAALPLETAPVSGKPTPLTLRDALMILTAERLLRRGMTHAAALACASSIAGDYAPIIADETAVAYAFFLRGDDGLHHATVAQSKDEAADLLDSQPDAVVLALHSLAREFLGKIAPLGKADHG